MERLTWHIGTFRGTPIYVHWSMWLFLLMLELEAFFVPEGGLQLALARCILWGGLFGFVLWHELAHVAAAATYGLPTERVVLHPFGGTAVFTRPLDRPRQELVVVLAGPASNLLLSGVFLLMRWVLERLFHPLPQPTPAFPSPPVWAYLFSLSNLFLALFNLLPAFPLDGGRALRALLAMRLSYKKATQIVTFVAQLLALLFVIGALFLGDVTLLVVGLLSFFAAAVERYRVEKEALLRSVTAREILVEELPTFQADDPVDKLTKSLEGEYALIVDAEGKPVGFISRYSGYALGASNVDIPLSQIMDSPIVRVSPATSLEEVWCLLQEEEKHHFYLDEPMAVVMEGDRVMGYVDKSTIRGFLSSRGFENEGLPSFRQMLRLSFS